MRDREIAISRVAKLAGVLRSAKGMRRSLVLPASSDPHAFANCDEEYANRQNPPVAQDATSEASRPFFCIGEETNSRNMLRYLGPGIYGSGSVLCSRQLLEGRGLS
jgi:hypothetical protein